MSEGRVTWHPAGIYKGIFDGFLIQANRHIEENREQTAWHVVSYSNSGDFGHRDYWVVDGQFRKTLRQTLEPFEVTTGEIIDGAPDVEREAILKAIKEWAGREPDVA